MNSIAQSDNDGTEGPDTEDQTQIDYASSDVDFDDPASEESNTPLTRKGLIQALKQGVENGILNKQQADQIRFENGITQSSFTKRTNVKQNKHKRKLQKQARKATRRQGFKGQKMERGKRVVTR